MKPCSQNKKHLAWLALDALDSERAGKLRAHLEVCPGCRQYWADVSALPRDHQRAAQALPEARAEETFHRRLEQRIQADAARPGVLRILDTLWRSVSPLNMPFVSVGAVVIVAVLALVWTSRHRPSPAPRPTDIALTAPLPQRMESATLPPPTLSAYRMAPNKSPDALDELLARQAAGSSSGGNARTLYAFRRADVEP